MITSHHPDIRVEQQGTIVTVTIDRPASKNACTGDMWVALGATFRDVSHAGVRAVVLTGANSDFCTGADLGAKGGSGGSPSDSLVHGMRVLGDVVVSIHDCPVPVIAKVDGLCVGAGLGLALAADLTWCSDRARFSAIFAKRGLSLDFGTSWLLRQRIGVHKAKEMAFTAKIVSATEARDLGFVNAVVSVSDLDAVVQELAETVAAGPPLALSMTKRELNLAAGSSLTAALELETYAQAVNTHTDDMREAMAAYLERRPPVFTGQ